MIRVMSVFGTRPEAIKMAPVVRALRADSARFESLVCVTAQHRTMLDQVLDVFGLVTNDDLDLMVPGQTPASVAGGVLAQLPAVIKRARPDVVLVQGDTMTTFGAAFRGVPRAGSDGPHRGGVAHRQSLAPVPGGDEPGAHHAHRGHPLRADGECARRAARRRGAGRATCISPATP